jgi:hypothetical protein
MIFQSIPQPQRRPHWYLSTPPFLLIRRKKIFHPARPILSSRGPGAWNTFSGPKYPMSDPVTWKMQPYLLIRPDAYHHQRIPEAPLAH